MAEPTTMNAKERRKLQRQQQQQEETAGSTTVAIEAEVKTEDKTDVKTVVKKEENADNNNTLNAKERRKLQRQQQQQEQEASVSEAKNVVKSDGNAEAAGDMNTMNAKERRKLVREQQRLQEESSAKTKPATAATETASGERLNAKQRRLMERKASRGEPTDNAAAIPQLTKKRKRKADEEDTEENAKKKRIHLTLFVGQLPYKCTESMVRKHFAEAGEITLRMLTDKKTKKFKGTAFIEVKDSKALGAALSRHHSLLNGRRINVELTASGGGNNSEQRRSKIDSLRKKQSEKQLEKTRALVQKYIDAPGSKLKKDDVDERMIDFLSWFDYTTAKAALEAYTTSVTSRVNNTKAFFMGILKRFRSTDGVE